MTGAWKSLRHSVYTLKTVSNYLFEFFTFLYLACEHIVIGLGKYCVICNIVTVKMSNGNDNFMNTSNNNNSLLKSNFSNVILLTINCYNIIISMITLTRTNLEIEDIIEIYCTVIRKKNVIYIYLCLLAGKQS